MLAHHWQADHRTSGKASPASGEPRSVRVVSLVCVGLIALTVCAMAYQLATTDRSAAVRRCAAIATDATRLACYDALGAPANPAKGAGASSDPRPGAHP
jgi:hypothetical protein